MACALTGLLAPAAAHAQGRFGDSTWVAPVSPAGDPTTSPGPRVAERDHERRWETALRAPFRVAFFPLRLLADGFEQGVGYAGPRYIDPKAPQPPRRGPVLAPHVSPSALNDVGVGPSLTWRNFPAAGADLHATGSWSLIDRRRVHISETAGAARPVGFRLAADYDRKPNRSYYGIGNDSRVSDHARFMLAGAEAQAAVLLGASPLRRVRLTGGYSSMTARSGSHGSPLVENVFTPAEAPFELQVTRELVYGVAAGFAALDDAHSPSRGVDGRLDARRAMGVRDRDPDYDQWRFEGRAYLPVFAKRRVIALRASCAGVDPRGDLSPALPLYRFAQSVDDDRFAGYDAERFRDLRLVHARLEYRWVVFHEASALLLYDLGEVAPRLGDLTLGARHESYGAGFRYGLNDVAAVRGEIAKSVEGVHASLALGSDF